MRDLNGGYARAFNDQQGRRDHVFGRRFHAVVIESEEQYDYTVDYVVQNPSATDSSIAPRTGGGPRRRRPVL
jgi:hypothetical protein